MICIKCRNKQHTQCPEGSWCDCQHKDSGINWPLVRKPETVVADPTTKPVDCL